MMRKKNPIFMRKQIALLLRESKRVSQCGLNLSRSIRRAEVLWVVSSSLYW